MRRFWTTEEDRVIRWHYRSRSAREVQEILAGRGFERSVGSVHWRARVLGVRHGETTGTVALIDVHPQGSKANVTAIRRAAEDGVLRRCVGMGGYRVPVEWADAYAREVGDMLEAERRARSWLKTADVAEAMGIDRSLVLKAAVGDATRRVQGVLGPVRRVRGYHHARAWYWHPADVAVAVMRYRGLRRAA